MAGISLDGICWPDQFQKHQHFIGAVVLVPRYLLFYANRPDISGQRPVREQSRVE
jgi:hypothetical protein